MFVNLSSDSNGSSGSAMKHCGSETAHRLKGEKTYRKVEV